MRGFFRAGVQVAGLFKLLLTQYAAVKTRSSTQWPFVQFRVMFKLAWANSYLRGRSFSAVKSACPSLSKQDLRSEDGCLVGCTAVQSDTNLTDVPEVHQSVTFQKTVIFIHDAVEDLNLPTVREFGRWKQSLVWNIFVVKDLCRRPILRYFKDPNKNHHLLPPVHINEQLNSVHILLHNNK